MDRTEREDVEELDPSLGDELVQRRGDRLGSDTVSRADRSMHDGYRGRAAHGWYYTASIRGLSAPPPIEEGAPHVALSLGIVGLPNVGKSTLFTALTRKDADAANYPFATIEPNVGLVEVPDARLDALAEIVNPQRDAAGGRRVRRHRGPGEGRERGRGARQPVPRQHPRDRRHLRGRALLLGPQRHPRRGPREPRERRRDDPHRARARRPRHHRARAAAAREGSQARQDASSSRSRSPSGWPSGWTRVTARARWR